MLEATRGTRPVGDERFAGRHDYYGRTGTWKTIVRDCSWHPSAPIIAATSWNGWDHGLGTCTVHSWNEGQDEDEVEEGEEGERFSARKNLGSTPMGARVTAQLQHDGRYYHDPDAGRMGGRRTGLRSQGLGALWGDEEDEDEDF